MSTYSLLPVISRPTRITEQTSSLIDNIFIKYPMNFQSGLLISTISDHLPVFIIKTIDCTEEQMSSPKTVRFRPSSDRKIALFRERLESENFEPVINQNDLDSAWLAFSNRIFKGSLWLFKLFFYLKSGVHDFLT